MIIGSLICEVIYLGFYYAGPEDIVPYNRKSLISEYLIYEDFYKEKRYEKSGPVLVVPYKRVSLISEYLIPEVDCIFIGVVWCNIVRVEKEGH